jgi:hypothetical protein
MLYAPLKSCGRERCRSSGCRARPSGYIPDCDTIHAWDRSAAVADALAVVSEALRRPVVSLARPLIRQLTGPVPAAQH